MAFLTEPVAVRVPATSANLGPGFDTLGLALRRFDEVRARVVAEGVSVHVTGEGAADLPTDSRHLIVRTMRKVFEELGETPPGLLLECHNRIPQARGLGSSSAAIVAGILLARALVEGGAERLDDAAVLRIAADLEGHPDNVAPCLLGGLTLAWTGPSGAQAVRLEPDSRVRFFSFVPDEQGLTETARAALPSVVPHRDAAFNAARSALLVHALTRDPAQLLTATEDRLHQPYRAASMPATAELVKTLREQGVPAVVSGAGPTVLAMVAGDWTPAPLAGWVIGPLAVDLTGGVLGDARSWGTLEHAVRDPVAAGWAS